MCLVYARAVGFEFLNYDDPWLLTSNTLVREGGWTNLARIFGGPLFGDYQPLSLSTFFFEWRLVGGAPWLYHLDNVLLHGLSAVLVAKVLEPVLGSARGRAAALLFAVHPLAVEPVVWVASRKDVLMLPLLLGAVLASRRVERSGAAFALCVGLGVAALLSKTAAVVLPGLVLCDRWLLRKAERPWRREAPLILALTAVAAAGLVLKLVALRATGAPSPLAPEGISGRLDLVGVSLGSFALHGLWPLDLQVGYDPQGLSGVRRGLAWALCLGLPLFAFAARRRAVAYGIGWWLVALLPASQLLPFPVWVADRYAYPALPGLACAVVALVPRGERGRLLLALLLAASTWLATQQSLLWKDSRTLWSALVARQPGHPVATSNLARTLAAGGEEGAARRLLEEQQRRAPGDLKAGRLLAVLRARAGDLDGAEELHWSLGPSLEYAQLLVERGRVDEAVRVLTAALVDQPGEPGLLLLRGQLSLTDGARASARADLEAAVRADPTRARGWQQLARACAGVDGERAREALRRGEQVGLPPTVVGIETSRLLAAEGQTDAARGRLLEVLRMEPGLRAVAADDPLLAPLLRAP